MTKDQYDVLLQDLFFNTSKPVFAKDTKIRQHAKLNNILEKHIKIDNSKNKKYLLIFDDDLIHGTLSEIADKINQAYYEDEFDIEEYNYTFYDADTYQKVYIEIQHQQTIKYKLIKK